MAKSSTKAARATRGSPRKAALLQCRQCPDLPLRSQCAHSTEGRLFLEQRSGVKVERAPQHCNKCPGRPLRSQCTHTNAGREYLRQIEIEQRITASINFPIPVTTSGSTTAGAPTITPEPSVASLSLLPSSNAPPAAGDDIPIDPALLAPTAPVERDSAPDMGLGVSEHSNPAHETPPRPPFIIPIDPVFSTPTTRRQSVIHVTPFTPTPQSERSLHASSSDVFASSCAESSVQSSRSSPSSLVNPRKKYQRPTKNNPKFGFVKGAMRGTHELDILRKHLCPDPSKDAVSASRDFLEGMHRVLEKAEDVSAKTGCWIFVGAQHPGAVGGTIHYTSPRLRRDAPEDAERLVNDYNILMTSLLRARRSDALEASKKLEEEVQKNAQLQQQVSALKDQIRQYSTRLDTL